MMRWSANRCRKSLSRHSSKSLYSTLTVALFAAALLSATTATAGVPAPGLDGGVINIGGGLRFVGSLPNPIAGQAFSVQVQVFDTASQTDQQTPNVSVSLALEGVPGGAIVSGGTVLTNGAGRAVFSSVVIESAGEGATLRATAQDYDDGVSAAFSIRPADIDHVTFDEQPADVAAQFFQGVALSTLRVCAEDVFGNRIANAYLYAESVPSVSVQNLDYETTGEDGCINLDAVTVNDVATNLVFEFYDDFEFELVGTTDPIDVVNPSNGLHFEVTYNPTAPYVTEDFSITIQAKDDNDQDITNVPGNFRVRIVEDDEFGGGGSGAVLYDETHPLVLGAVVIPNFSVHHYALISIDDTTTPPIEIAYEPGVNLVWDVDPTDKFTTSEFDNIPRVVLMDPQGGLMATVDQAFCIRVPSGQTNTTRAYRNMSNGALELGGLNINQVATAVTLSVELESDEYGYVGCVGDGFGGGGGTVFEEESVPFDVLSGAPSTIARLNSGRALFAACSKTPAHFQIRDAHGNPSGSLVTTSFGLSSPSPSRKYYSDVACNQEISSVPIVVGQTDFFLYYSDTVLNVEGLVIDAGFTTLNTNLDFSPGRIAFEPSYITTPLGVCSQLVTATAVDGQDAYNFVEDVDINIYSNDSTTIAVFEDNNGECGTPLDLSGGTATITLGPDTPSFSFHVIETTPPDFEFDDVILNFGDASNSTFSSGDALYVNVVPLVADDLNFLTYPTTVVAGESFSVQVEATLQSSRATDWDEQMRLSYATNPEGAPNLSRNANPTAGVSTFNNVNLTRAGEYSLRADSGASNYLNTISPTFDVVPAAPSTFVVVPDSTTAFIATCSQPIRVSIADAYSNPYYSNSATTISVSPLASQFGIYNSTTSCGADSTGQNQEVISLPAGQTEAIFYIKSNIEQTVLFTTNVAGLQGQNTTINITDPNGAQVQIDSIDDPVRVGAPFTLLGSVRDADDELLNWPALVEVDLGPGAPGALSGTLSQLGGDGNLMFDDLSVDAAGTYTVILRSGALVAQQTVTVLTGPPNAIVFSTPPRAPLQGACSGEVRFVANDLEGNLAFVDAGAVATLSIDPGTVDLFSDVDCAVPLTSPFEIPLVNSGGAFSFRSAQVGNVTTTVDVAIASGSQGHNVLPSGAELPGALEVTGDAAPLALNTCSGAISFSLLDNEAQPAPLPFPTDMVLSADTDDVTFFTGGNCDAAVEGDPRQIPLASSTQEGTLSFLAATAGVKTLTFTIPGIPAATLVRTVVDDGQTAPAAILFETPARISQVGLCSASIRAGFVDAAGETAGLLAETVLGVNVSPSFTLYNSDDCSGAAIDPSTGLTLDEGTESVTLTFRSNAATTTTLSLSIPGLTGADQALTAQEGEVEPPDLAFRFDTAPFNGPAGICAQGIRIVLEDEDGNAATLDDDLSISLAATSGSVNFFNTDPVNACDIPPLVGGQLMLPAGQSAVSFHFADPAAGELTFFARAEGVAEASQVQTLTAAGLSAPVIVDSANRSGAVGVPYIYSTQRVAEVSAGTPQITWTKVSGPDGFRINSQTGFVTWTPQDNEVGDVEIEIQASNSVPPYADTLAFTVTVIDEIEVDGRDPPSVVITVEDDTGFGPAPHAVSVNGEESRTADDALPTLVWDFGDGSRTLSEPRVSTTYALPGSYVIKLRAQDEVGLTATASEIISVFDGDNAPPRARISSEVIEEGEESKTINFSCECAIGSAPIVSYRWEFENGLTSNNEEVTQVFGIGGYVVRLTVADENGLVATDTFEVEVAAPGKSPPIVSVIADPVSATLAPGGAPIVVSFNAIYGDLDGEIEEVSWIENDQVFASTPTTTRTYSDLGTYEVRFEARDNDGFVTSRLLSIRITAPDGTAVPEIVSVPNTDARVGQEYQYSDDGRVVVRGTRPLTFVLGYPVGDEIVGRPDGMRIDPTSGVVTWVPEASAGSEVSVAIVVSNRTSDGTEYFDIQDFVINLEGGIDPEPDTEVPPDACGCSTVAAGPTSTTSGHPMLAVLAGIGIGFGLRRRRQAT